MDLIPRNRDQPDEETALGPDAQRRQRSSIPSFLFISFLFFMLTNHSEEDAVARFQYKDAIQALEYQISNYSSWLVGNESNFFLVSTLCLPDVPKPRRSSAN
jgi:transmembrane E3 ubiquitin-protein ligase